MTESLDQIREVASKLAQDLDSGVLVAPDDLAAGETGISLLNLKNQSLLAYINNLVIVAGSQLLKAQGDDSKSTFDSAVKGAITHRVVLEKGIKGLESKITYQLEKALRAYKKHVDAENAGKKDDSDLGDAADSADSDSDDPTQYRPNLGQLRNSAARNGEEPDDSDDGGDKKYRAPKISATAPTTSDRRARPRRDYAMEDYIRDTGDAPISEPSIGSTIMDHGRGGERTARDRRKQSEVDTYEEDNFTRIQKVSAKQGRRDARQRQQDAITKSFFGEDWGLGGDDGAGNKRRKPNGGSKSKRRRH